MRMIGSVLSPTLLGPSKDDQMQLAACVDDESPLAEIQQFIVWADQCLETPPEDESKILQINEHAKMGDLIYTWTAHLPTRAFTDCWVSRSSKSSLQQAKKLPNVQGTKVTLHCMRSLS